MSQTHPLQSTVHYIRLSLSPPTPDPLTIRKSLSDSLLQSFGLTSASSYIDVLWVDQSGQECVIRADPGDARKILAAIVTTNETPRMSLIKESSFLPAILTSNSSDL